MLPTRVSRHALCLFGLALLACSGATESDSTQQSPLAGRIVFSRETSDSTWALYSMAPDGSDERLIIARDDLSFFVPVVSPDGLRIAVETSPPNVGRNDLYVLDPDGSHLTPVFVPGLNGVSWSPDSKRLVAGGVTSSSPVGESPAAIFVVNADGTGLLQLTHSPVGKWTPTWSPDGTHIAFVSDSIVDSLVGGTWKVFIMQSDGSHAALLTANSAFNMEPVWSRDGQWIAFTSSRSGYPNEVFLIHPDGSDERQLTFGQNGGACGAVSPDGTSVALCIDNQLYSVQVDATGLTPLTPALPRSAWPSWGPPQ